MNRAGLATLARRSQAIWPYARHELLYVGWGAMEATLVGAFALSLLPWAHFWPATQIGLLLLLITLLPLQLGRLLDALNLPPTRRRLVQLGALLLTLLLALRLLLHPEGSFWRFAWLRQVYSQVAEEGNPFWVRDITLTVLLMITWLRGMSFAGRMADIDRLGLGLRLGGLVLLPLAVAFAGPPLALRVLTLVLLYFLAALMTAALTRAEEIATGQLNQGYAMTPRWLGSIFATSLLIIFVAGLLGAMLGNHTLDFLGVALGPLWLALYFAGITVLSAVSYLAQPFLLFFSALLEPLLAWLRAWWAGILARLPQSAPQATPSSDNGLLQQLLEAARDAPEVNAQHIRNLFIAIALLVIILLVFFSGNMFRRRGLNMAGDGERFTPASGSQDAGTLGRFWHRLAGFRRRQAAASVRRFYLKMCDAAASNGYPRLESETPLEYLASLHEVWPDGDEGARLITTAFIRVRYGQIPETGAELEAIRQAWQQLEMSLPARR